MLKLHVNSTKSYGLCLCAYNIYRKEQKITQSSSTSLLLTVDDLATLAGLTFISVLAESQGFIESRNYHVMVVLPIYDLFVQVLV